MIAFGNQDPVTIFQHENSRKALGIVERRVCPNTAEAPGRLHAGKANLLAEGFVGRVATIMLAQAGHKGDYRVSVKTRKGVISTDFARMILVDG